MRYVNKMECQLYFCIKAIIFYVKFRASVSYNVGFVIQYMSSNPFPGMRKRTCIRYNIVVNINK